MRASRPQFKKLHALYGDYARAFPGTTSAQWKEVLGSLYPAFLAEAEGRPIPEPAPRESTLAMSGHTMNDVIEFAQWLGCCIGVEFPEDDDK